jgi:glycosyltransferase involved in cell wall biosynthesis
LLGYGVLPDMKVGYLCYHLSGNGPRTRACDVINAVADRTDHHVVVLTGEPERVSRSADIVPIAADKPFDALRKARRQFSGADLVHAPVNVYQALFARLAYCGPMVVGVGPGTQSTHRHGLLGRAIGIDFKIRTHEYMTRWERYGYETAICTATLDRDVFYPYDDERIRALRESMGIPAEADVLLYVGRLNEYKGARLVSELARLLEDETVLIVAGEGELEAEFEDREDLRYEGFVDNRELPDYFNVADVTLIPRETDVTCNVGIESIACGTPAITTAEGVIRLLFEDYGTYVWAEREPAAVRDAAFALLEDEERYREQVERGFETLEGMNMSLEDALRTHLEVYERVANG